jgi:hypothetical protein
MKRLLICVMAAFVLAGCAATNPNKAANDRYDETMKLFLGESESFVVNIWGPPDRVYELDGVKYLKYSSYRTVAVPAPMQVSAPSYNRFMMYGGGSASVSCDNTFKIKNDIVVSINYHGNGCR